jgi:hypothetical protein
MIRAPHPEVRIDRKVMSNQLSSRAVTVKMTSLFVLYDRGESDVAQRKVAGSAEMAQMKMGNRTPKLKRKRQKKTAGKGKKEVSAICGASSPHRRRQRRPFCDDYSDQKVLYDDRIRTFTQGRSFEIGGYVRGSISSLFQTAAEVI